MKKKFIIISLAVFAMILSISLCNAWDCDINGYHGMRTNVLSSGSGSNNGDGRFRCFFPETSACAWMDYNYASHWCSACGDTCNTECVSQGGRTCMKMDWSMKVLVYFGSGLNTYNTQGYWYSCNWKASIQTVDTWQLARYSGAIQWDSASGDWLCTGNQAADTGQWIKASDNKGKVYWIGQDILSNGGSWIWCDSKNDGGYHGDHGIRRGDSEIAGADFGLSHDYLCYHNTIGGDYESFAECCGDSTSNCLSSPNGVRVTSGTKIGNYYCKSNGRFCADAQSPQGTITMTGTMGENGWNKSAAATLTCSDDCGCSSSNLCWGVPATTDEGCSQGVSSASLIVRDGTLELKGNVIDISGKNLWVYRNTKVDGKAPQMGVSLESVTTKKVSATCDDSDVISHSAGNRYWDTDVHPSGCNTGSYKLKVYTYNPGSCPSGPNDYTNTYGASPQTLTQNSWVCAAGKDNAGNYGFSGPAKFEFTPPTVSVSCSTDPGGSISCSPGLKTGEAAYIIATASDESGVTELKIYVDDALKTTCPVCGGCQVSPCSYTGGPYAEGSSHTYYASATDGAGNIGRDPSTGTKTFFRVAACVPATCSGKECGTMANGTCSGTLNCGPLSTSCTSIFGTCSAPGTKTCGINNMYGSCSATDPRTANCAGKSCGSDGCGGSCSPGCSGATPTCNANGQCVCSSTCSSGAIQCSSGSAYQTCGDYNGDGCLEFGGASTNCPSSGTCASIGSPGTKYTGSCASNACQTTQAAAHEDCSTAADDDCNGKTNSADAWCYPPIIDITPNGIISSSNTSFTLNCTGVQGRTCSKLNYSYSNLGTVVYSKSTIGPAARLSINDNVTCNPKSVCRVIINAAANDSNNNKAALTSSEFLIDMQSPVIEKTECTYKAKDIIGRLTDYPCIKGSTSPGNNVTIVAFANDSLIGSGIKDIKIYLKNSSGGQDLLLSSTPLQGSLKRKNTNATIKVTEVGMFDYIVYAEDNVGNNIKSVAGTFNVGGDCTKNCSSQTGKICNFYQVCSTQTICASNSHEDLGITCCLGECLNRSSLATCRLQGGEIYNTEISYCDGGIDAPASDTIEKNKCCKNGIITARSNTESLAWYDMSGNKLTGAARGDKVRCVGTADTESKTATYTITIKLGDTVISQPATLSVNRTHKAESAPIPLTQVGTYKCEATLVKSPAKNMVATLEIPGEETPTTKFLRLLLYTHPVGMIIGEIILLEAIL